MLLSTIIILAASFLLSAFGTWIMRGLSPRLGLVDQPGQRKLHSRPMPCGGGVSIFLAIWLPVAGAAIAAWASRSLHIGLPAGLEQHLGGVLTRLPKLACIFAGSLVIWIVGLADDRRGLSPWLRLAVQLGVGALLVAGGIRISVFIRSPLIHAALTMIWVVAITNAFNMLDNMDGLSAGVATIISAIFAVLAFLTGHAFIGAFLCCIVGACLGFLIHNFPPARIYLGCGASVIGFMLAAISVECTFYDPLGHPNQIYFPIAVPLLLFALPLFDMTTVVWIRLREGRSPLVGDANHFSHRLVGLGMTPRQAVMTIYLISATVALGATALYEASNAAVLVVLCQAVSVFIIIGILERVRPQAQRTPPAR